MPEVDATVVTLVTLLGIVALPIGYMLLNIIFLKSHEG